MKTALCLAALVAVSACKSDGSAPAEKAAARPAAQQPVAESPPPPPPAPPPAPPADSVLMNPSRATEKAPETFRVRLDTTQGPVTIEVHRAWAPEGADRFYNLVKAGFYDDIAFFRALPGFMNQVGIPGDPRVAAKWREANIPDDPVKESNKRGYVTFAKSSMPNSRTTQIFINKRDNASLDGMGFAPFGQVVEGLDHVDAMFTGYGETVSQPRLQMEGNTYLRAEFPRLDWIKSAKISG